MSAGRQAPLTCGVRHTVKEHKGHAPLDSAPNRAAYLRQCPVNHVAQRSTEIVVCLNCSAAQFAIQEADLRLLQKSNAAREGESNWIGIEETGSSAVL